MNLDQVLSLVRALLLVMGALLMKHGLTNDSTWTDITGGILTIVPLAWSFYHHSDTNQVAKAVTVLQNQTKANTNETKTPTPPPAPGA